MKNNKNKKKIKMSKKDIFIKKLTDMFKNASFSVAFSSANKLSGGLLPSAIKHFYKEKYMNKVKDTEYNRIGHYLMDNFKEIKNISKRLEKDKELDNRKDSNTSTELDNDSIALDCIFSGESGNQLVRIANDMRDKISVATNDMVKMQEQAKSEIDKLGLKIDKKYREAIEPVIFAMIKDNKSKEEIQKAIDSMKTESLSYCNEKMAVFESANKRLKNKFVLSDRQKERILFESIWLNDKIKNDIILPSVITLLESINIKNNRQIISEGGFDMLSAIFGKAAQSSSALKFIGSDIVADYENIDDLGITHSSGDYYKFFGKEVTNIQPVIKNVKNGAKVLAAWAPLVAIAALTIVDKYKKNIRNICSSTWKKFSNKKGVIAEMEFQTIPTDKSPKYWLQFNVKDFKWRIMNKKNILHYPDKKLITEVLSGEIGKKFRNYCKKTWDPLFKSIKDEDKSAFIILIENSKTLELDKNIVKFLSDIGNSYEKIEKDCLSDNYKYDIRPR